jgi:hypothetical protein|nr:MAG TPA: Protein of unknown function (DUF1492) [Caudoviricetes sp.]
MTYEETKKALNSLREKKRLLKKQEEQIRQARNQIDCLKATDYSKIAVQGGNKEFIAEVFVEHMERLQKSFEETFNEVVEIEDYIAERLADLSEMEQAIIFDRYMLGKSWKKIQMEFSEEKPYSERRLYDFHKSGIKKITKRLQ